MQESEGKISELAGLNVKTILDYSVEGKETEKDFDQSYKLIQKTIDNASGNPNIPFAVFKVTGMARFKLLEKINLEATLSPSESAEIERVRARIDGICKRAFKKNIPVLIDAEESWIQNAIDSFADENMKKYNSKNAIVFNTVQLYRHDRLEYLKNSIEKARTEGYKYGIKLVRGAYLEKERDRAENMDYPSPIHSTKEDTDRDFNESIRVCMNNLDMVSMCCGSHNELSSKLLVDHIQENGLKNDDQRIYFAQLLGMSDHISFNLSHHGYNVAKYVPFGPVYEVTPYLIRRTEENTSISGQSGRELSLIKKERVRRKSV